MKKIKILYPVWAFVCIILAYLAIQEKNQTNRFKGVTELDEIVINTEYPVEIKRVHVMPGQAVAKGELLIELQRPDLIKKINEISHEKKKMMMQLKLKELEIQSQAIQLKTERKSVASEFEYKIKQYESRCELNRKLAENLKSIRPSTAESENKKSLSLASLEIEALKKERDLALEGINLRIKILEDSIESIGKPINVQIQGLENELALLNSEEQDLYVYSEYDGVIGSVNFNPGEKASPFNALLTIHSRNPSIVKGYVPEEKYDHLKKGQTVQVYSLTSPNNTAEGEIVSVGSRIVPYPERLWIRPEIPSWGRELQIKINKENNLLLGEKVMIVDMNEQSEFSSYFALFDMFVRTSYSMTNDEDTQRMKQH